VSVDYVVAQIIDRMNPDELVDLLDLEMPVLVEALRDHIADQRDRIEEYLEI
jgi:hypothetical protein